MRTKRRFALWLQTVGLVIPLLAHGANLTLRWTDMSDNEDGFKVERKLGTAGTYAEVSRTATNVVLYAETTLAFATQYCYRIRAYNAAGDSAYSNEACGTTLANPLPATPGGLTVTALP